MEIVDAAMVAKGSTPVPQNSGKMCGLVAEIKKKGRSSLESTWTKNICSYRSIEIRRAGR
jgi:hypothetical protein